MNDGNVPIDNNGAEKAVRPLVVRLLATTRY
ncbi:transposase [Rhodoferax sp.]|nr:transposase [Rhodoferax sp.]MDO8320949.1 transposase [Rhodoferax sp.]